MTADATVTDTTVTNLRQVEAQGENECLTVDRYAAITNLEGNLEWDSGVLTDNEGYGISNVRGSLNASNSTFSNNNCAGVMNFGGTDILTGNTFSQTKPGQLSAAVVEYGNSGSLIDGNTFTDNQNTGEYLVVYDYSKYYDEKTCEANPYYCYTDTYTYLDKPEAVDQLMGGH